MTQPRLIRRTLTEFFRDLLRGAMRSQDVESSEGAEYYLVALLERFAHPEPDWDARPLAIEYLESFHSPTPFRFAKLKHVGDTALFLAGIFMEHLERQLVSADYYTSLGRIAYGHLASLSAAPARGHHAVFAEMSERFPEFVRVLAEISFEQLFPGDEQKVRIYTRWLRTRGRRDTEWLLRHGIIPVEPHAGRTRH
jgi:hypothetical protein